MAVWLEWNCYKVLSFERVYLDWDMRMFIIGHRESCATGREISDLFSVYSFILDRDIYLHLHLGAGMTGQRQLQVSTILSAFRTKWW